MTKEVMNWNDRVGGKKAERIPCPDGIEGCLVVHYKVIEEKSNQEQETTKCKTHPDAPHGFVRNASHSEDRYVCECEFWEPPEQDDSVIYIQKVIEALYENSDPVSVEAAELLERINAKQEQVEPYGYFRYDIRLDAWVQSRDNNKGVAFYTKPQTKEWVELTEYEIKGVLGLSESWVGEDCSIPDMIGFAKAIDAKLKEKNR